MTGANQALDDLRRHWRSAEASLVEFLDSVGATADAHTYTIRLVPRTIESPRQFADWLQPAVQDDGMWSFATTSGSGGQRHGYAMPVAGDDITRVPMFFFVEIHTQLVAWWLTAAWRTRQLAIAASSEFAADHVITSAACARPLVETAAAFWVDGRKIAAIWDETKRAGPLWSDEEAGARYLRMMAVINEVSWGAKFDDRAPEWERQWSERIGRSNVLGAVDKLAKASDNSLQADYQWLCNTVHPSVGNTFAFSAPPLIHDTRTHVITWYSGIPLHLERGDTAHAEMTVQTAIARATAVSLKVLRETLDTALRFIDDLALTTGAPKIARERYWRDLKAPEGRNEICPCRSGRKSKLCRHEWGDPAPGMSTGFDKPAMRQ